MKNEYSITSNQDNLKLSIVEYVPKKPKAIIQIAHGMSEHKERYEEIMSFLCDNGFLCVANDQRGHGKSIKDEKDLGYFYDPTGEYIVEDFHQITNYIKDKYPNLPVYLLGHSMGSLIIRKYIKKYDKDVEKLIVCGSPSENNYTGFGIFLTKLIMIFKGDRYRSKLLNKISIGNFDKYFKGEPKDSWINSDPVKVKEFKEDKKAGFIFTTNGFLNLFTLLKDTYSRKSWQVNNPDLKILFIAGEDDPVIVNKSAWLNSMTFLREIGYNNIDYLLYPNDRHEVLNEVNREEVYKDLLKFLNS